MSFKIHFILLLGVLISTTTLANSTPKYILRDDFEGMRGFPEKSLPPLLAELCSNKEKELATMANDLLIWNTGGDFIYDLPLNFNYVASIDTAIDLKEPENVKEAINNIIQTKFGLTLKLRPTLILMRARLGVLNTPEIEVSFDCNRKTFYAEVSTYTQAVGGSDLLRSFYGGNDFLKFSSNSLGQFSIALKNFPINSVKINSAIVDLKSTLPFGEQQINIKVEDLDKKTDLHAIYSNKNGSSEVSGLSSPDVFLKKNIFSIGTNNNNIFQVDTLTIQEINQLADELNTLTSSEEQTSSYNTFFMARSKSLMIDFSKGLENSRLVKYKARY